MSTMARLEAVGFPQGNIEGSVVHSTPDLVAYHFAPFDTGPDGRRLFWEPGDQIVDTTRRG